MNKDFLISIIMPVYNSERFIEKAIESVLAQSYENFELILVDDGSTDKSFSICKKMEEKDSRIVAYSKENGGVCSARNYGLSIAKGEYVTFIDNDDEYYPNLLEKIVCILINHPNIDVIKCGRKNITINEDFKILKETCFYYKDNVIYNSASFFENYGNLKLSGILSSVWNGLYKRSFLMDHRLTFREDFLSGNEDIYFNLECFKQMNSFASIPDALYCHYYRQNHSTSQKFKEKQIIDRIETIRNEFEMISNRRIGSWENEILAMNVKVCFRMLSVSKSKDERVVGIDYILRNIDMSKFEKISISSLKGVGLKEKIEMWILQKRFYQLYFAIHS